MFNFRRRSKNDSNDILRPEKSDEKLKKSIIESPVPDTIFEEKLSIELLKTPEPHEQESDEWGSLADPVSPPKIRRIARAGEFTHLTSIFERNIDPKSLGKENIPDLGSGARDVKSTCETALSTPIQIDEVVTPKDESPIFLPRRSEGESDTKGRHAYSLGKNNTTSNQIKQIKLAIPNILKSLSRISSKRKSIDVSDFTVASIYLLPRNGAGMTGGRLTFERVRTSLMLHMLQYNMLSTKVNMLKNGDKTKKQRQGGDPVARLEYRLRSCLSDSESTFVAKSQETVRIAKEFLNDWNDNGIDFECNMKNKENRSKICIQFLSGMYRDIVNSQEESSGVGALTLDNNHLETNDGLSLMVIGAAYYAVGDFDAAISVYQKAGVDLKQKISTSPKHMVHCAKLFNNMGCVYFEMRKYQKAMQTFQRALQLFHNDGQDDCASWIAAIMDQAVIMNNMAYTLIKFRQFDDASDLVDASFELQRIFPGNENTTMIISTISTMAFIHYRTKNYQKALDTYSVCFKLQGKSTMHDESDEVDVLKKMTEICLKERKYERAVHTLRCTLVRQQKYLPHDDEEIWETNEALGKALYASAELDVGSI